LAATTKIDFSSVPFGTDLPSISDDDLTVAFSELLNKRGPVPNGWQTWSSPPFSEDPNPFVLVSPSNTLTMELSRPVSIFGFEMEPDPFALILFTVDFFRETPW